MANTFELISSVTVGSGGAASIDFTSIPATYTDLCLELSLRSNKGSTFCAVAISFNGSTSSFSGKMLQGDGGSASSYAVSQNFMIADAASNTGSTFASATLYVPNYAGSTYKSFSSDAVHENNATTAYSNLMAGLWSNTAAINQITLTPDASSFVQYSTAYLYGVKNA